MANIKETKECLNFALSLGSAIARSLEDGKFSFSDLVYFFSAMQTATDAIEGAQYIPGELADMSKEEKAELIRFATSKFNIEQKDVERRIELGFATALNLVELINEFTGNVKNI
jgi:hypothetical protein